MERLVAALLLILLLPLLIGMATAIAILSRGAPLVAHRRIGQDGRPFWTLKFRTMWPRTGVAHKGLVQRLIDESGPCRKKVRDPHVTSRFARLLRRFSLDELPQLINVARGEMALVGPRPLTESELERHYAGVMDEVLSVKPGITGLWQVRGRSRLSYPRRRELDLLLVRQRSPRLYFEILLRTVPEVLGGRNGW